MQNLKQALAEVEPYLSYGLNSERLNIEIANEKPYSTVGIAFQGGLDYFVSHGALQKTLEYLDSSGEYKAAVAFFERPKEAVAVAEVEEQLVQENATSPPQALREAAAAALERAKRDPEFVKAQEPLAKIKELKK
ncbi:MAG: hypothetical protein WCP60_01190 [bacterium]